jgi:hypothetical protein
MASKDSEKTQEKISILPKATSFQQGYLGLEPSKVTGTLKINYPSTKPLIAKKIEVAFSGKEEIEWTEYQPNARGFTASVVHSEQHEFIYNVINIWEANEMDDDSNGKDNYKVLNDLELPFSFILENNLPPSSTIKFDDGSGRIYYRVVVVIYRKSNIFKLQGKKKVVKFTIPITRYARNPHQPEMIIWSSDNEKKEIIYDVKIDRNIFAKGELMEIPIRITLHNSQVKIKKVFVGIKQCGELWNAGSLVKRDKNHYPVWQEVKSNKIKLAADSEQGYYIEMNMKIPDDDTIKCSVNQSLIIIWHQVDVKINLEGADDILLERKVKIVNFSKK